MERVVSPEGLPGNAGTVDSPLSLAAGVALLEPGDVLLLRGGVYPGQVEVHDCHGTRADPIVIRSFPGEHAVIDGSLPEFRQAPNELWEPVGDPAIGQFVSSDPYPKDARGSFLDRDPHTRLITNSTLEDLLATNQLWGPLPPDSTLEGFPPAPGEERFPWVYMGPGIFQEPAGGVIHIRLAPTANNLPGFPDYAGPTDPRTVPLAIWTAQIATVLITNCDSVYLTELTVRHGHTCVKVGTSNDVRLDHVNILSGSFGIEIADASTGTAVTHCVVDGGLPSWYFRSDRKSGYRYLRDGVEEENTLGERTTRALLSGNRSTAGTTFSYCEFRNGHDLALFGTGTRFSRNWVANLDDDAIIAETEGIVDLRIFENVIEQSLKAISFAREKAGFGVAVFRNLIDLRRPTASIRPRPDNPAEPLAHGQLFKGNDPDGPLDVFHNTCLVADQRIGSSFSHFRSYIGDSLRRSFNNIFVAVNPTDLSDKPITFLPDPPFPAATDGNCYFRVGPFTEGPLLFHTGYELPNGQTFPGGSFDMLAELRGDPDIPTPPSTYFRHSQATYPPGFEASSIDTDPLFRHFDSVSGVPSDDDDFRLRLDSPAGFAGIILPEALRELDNAAEMEIPDIGCFRMSDPQLSVGVDGRRHFPRVATG